MMKLFILIMMVWAIFAIKAISLNDVTFKSLNDPITKTNFNKLNSNGPEQQHNTEEEKIFHVWCVSAFTKDYSTEPWHSVVDALIYGINLYGKHNSITKYDIKTVFKEEYVFTTNDSSLLRSNDSTHFESLSENEAFANSQFNKRLLKIPWSGALEEANSNIIAVIILTDYYAENLVTINGSQSLIGQMFIYNETTFESYNNAEKLKNSTQFHFYYLPSEVANITVVPITIPKHSPLNTSNTLNTSTKIFIICGSCACVFIIIFIGFLFYRRKKRKENIERMLQNALKKQSERRHIEPTTSIYDNWELTWERLVIKNDELSTGIHEQLLHGTLLSDFRNGAFQENSEVAIKMPNKYALEITKEKFLDEIYMMKKVTGDRNIIAMVGCITHEDQICLVMEFCANLDLLNYVREIKYNEKKMEENEKQTKKEFFIFGWQILHGLQYLKSKFIIHRNLTAKNILITAEKNAKITDFGLAIHESNKTESLSVYEKLRLPLKWLSIEALKNYTFSFESDIWAFGIILYEMYSFGEELYAEIDTDELLEYLKAKKRLEKPNRCLDKIFETMLNCWNEIPSTRPTIVEIIEIFTEVMKDSTNGYGYLELTESD